MPTILQMNLVNVLGMLLGAYLLRTGIGMLGPEGRFISRTEHRSYLPDLALILHRDEPIAVETLVTGPFERPPDLAIEVVSPGDRPVSIAEKVAFYLRAGVPITWVIDPADQLLTEFRPGRESIRYARGERVSAEPVLPGFDLDLDEAFSMVERLMRTPRP